MKNLCLWGFLLSNKQEIFHLPVEVSNKIAAGEVIDRPVNIVKELFENSVDAGSKNLTLEIFDGGLSHIKVSDDGNGIHPEDLPRSVKRFATSKIKNIEDIYSITSFGFRGEALAAISSVSNFRIVSKQKNMSCYSLAIDFGDLGEVKPSNGINGTVISVDNLFENIPARRKFLKSPGAEQREIVRFVKHFAMINYMISLKIIVNGKQHLLYPAKEDMLLRAESIFNEDKLYSFSDKYESMKISGVISNPEVQKVKRDNIVISVNKRIVKDNMIVQSVIQAYKRLIPDGKFPVACISLELNPAEVDVNVHPAKLFVKFRDSGEMFSFVYDAIKHKLESLKPTDGIQEQNDLNLNISASPGKYENNNIHYLHSSAKPETSVHDIVNTETYENLENDDIYSGNSEDFKIMGQLFNTVIICEFDDFYFKIDQHIAHERILYEKYKNNLTVDIPTITLSEPVVIELDSDEHEMIKDNRAVFQSFGYDFEDFGGSSIKLGRLPVNILNKDIKSEITDILKEIDNLSGSKNIKDSAMVVMACKSAIKAGEKLSDYEMRQLVRELLKTSNPFTCPHGRPIIIRQTKEELFRKFHR